MFARVHILLVQLYLIGYTCGIKVTNKRGDDIRELYFPDEFVEFYSMLQDKVKVKLEHTMDIIRTEYVLSMKFVKHLENKNLYETRVSVNINECRTILFAANNDNIILSKKVLFLSGLLKKSIKDYGEQIKIVERILKDFEP